MVNIHAPSEFWMGSKSSESGRSKHEQRHRVRIPRSFAIATTEVTVEQFLRFKADHEYDKNWAPESNHPVGRITWHLAANYCNWLSEQHGIPEEQWCYPKNFGFGMPVPDDFLNRDGFRLATEAEWEYACRAGTETTFYFGRYAEMLNNYGNFANESSMVVASLKPNQFGLFDMAGNAWEYCHDAFKPKEDHNRPSLIDGVDKGGLKSDPDDKSELNLIRGGSAQDPPVKLRSAMRNGTSKTLGASGTGFRIAKTISQN